LFRDELGELLPSDEDARRLRTQVFLIGEFLEAQAKDFKLPQLHRKALVHGHCHHKALMKMDAEHALLRRMGVDFQELDSGCCGMAGAFGFEQEHYDVSIAAGERVLLPAVRAASTDTLIIADGFSCREQIAQCTERRALHPVQVVQMALSGASRQPAEYPEREFVTASADGSGPARLEPGIAALVALGLGAAAATWWWRQRSRNGEPAARAAGG
jgi:Fe-S oxidoreductase